MSDLIHTIKDWIQNSNEKLIIGISGHGAAGKTTFAQQLMQELTEDVNFLNTDPYIVDSAIRKYTTIDYLYNEISYHSKMTAGHPAAHNIASLERDIHMLKNDMDLLTIDTHYSPSEILSSQNKLTIVEGMGVAFTNPQLFDLLIYFYTDGQTEFERRTIRDIKERGMDINYLKQSHEDRRMQYETFMHPYSKNFDFIIKSTQSNPMNIEKNTFDFKNSTTVV